MGQILKSLQQGRKIVSMEFAVWAGNKVKYAINMDGPGLVAWIRKEHEPQLYYLLNEDDAWTRYGSV